MAQKASSIDKIKILSFETKIIKLEDKLEDLKLDSVFHDLNTIREVIKELIQINSSTIKQLKDDLNLKNYKIKYMKKRIEAKDIIYK